MSSTGDDIIENVATEDHWTILSDVYKMLMDANVLNTPASTRIIDFKHPDELKVCRYNKFVI